MIEYDKIKIEKLQAELASAYADIAKFQEMNIDQPIIEIFKESAKNKEKELSRFLLLVEVEDELNEKTNYYLRKNGKELHLNSLFDEEITETPFIYSNDLVFITANRWDGSELDGIFSFEQQKLIFPFIIENFKFEEDGSIFLTLEEHWSTSDIDDSILDDELNRDNNFIYLNADCTVFQNEGHLVEQLGPNHYILEEPNDRSLFILYGPSDLDENIAVVGISEYYFDEEFHLLTFKTSKQTGVFDILNSKVLFKKEISMEIERLNNTLFQCSIRNYYQILNSQGEIVFQYTLHDCDESWRSKPMNEDETYIEFYIENRLFKGDFFNLNIATDYIGIIASDVIQEKSVIVNINSGITSILDLDIYELDRLIEEYTNAKRKDGYEIDRFINSALKKGAKFQSFDFYSDYELIKQAFSESCQNLLERKVSEFRNEFAEFFTRPDDNKLEKLNWGLIADIKRITKGSKFHNGSFLFVGKSGIIRHLLIDNDHLFSGYSSDFRS